MAGARSLPHEPPAPATTLGSPRCPETRRAPAPPRLAPPLNSTLHSPARRRAARPDQGPASTAPPRPTVARLPPSVQAPLLAPQRPTDAPKLAPNHRRPFLWLSALPRPLSRRLPSDCFSRAQVAAAASPPPSAAARPPRRADPRPPCPPSLPPRAPSLPLVPPLPRAP
eukprot:6189596-Pleurochrysis_carterae.AAC.2